MNTDSGYIISISKEQLARLPITSFPGKIQLIDKPSALHAAIRYLNKQKMVGFDTETKPSFRKGYRHKVALMQISTDDECFLFRLNKLGICAQLKAFLENPVVLKIGLSLHDDFNAISQTEPFEPKGFVDLQSMMKDYTITDISLQKVYAIIFGGKISKGQRLTNWEAARLTTAQQGYAALDAWACLKIFRYLSEGKFDMVSSPYRHLPPPPPETTPGEGLCQ